jgi:hypothetical protein
MTAPCARWAIACSTLHAQRSETARSSILLWRLKNVLDEPWGVHPDFGVSEAFSAVQTTLAELLRQGGAKSFRYHYDFGDDWVHTVKVEAVTDADPDSAYPRLLEARRACPPEDCGGGAKRDAWPRSPIRRTSGTRR